MVLAVRAEPHARPTTRAEDTTEAVLTCCNECFDLAPCFREMGSMPEIIRALEIQPQFWCGIEGPRETECHIWRHRSPFMQNLGERFP